MKILLIFSTLLFSSCAGYEPLIFTKNNFRHHSLKTNGYYYYLSNKDLGYGYTEKIYDTFMLFENGIYYNISFGGYNKNSNFLQILEKLDFNITSQVKMEKEYINTRPNWGIFKNDGSKIEIERWVFSSGGGNYPTQILIGEIKNDSTIHFHTKLSADPLVANRKKKTFDIDETYHFRQFSPKPDSTNKFIK